MLRRNIKSLQYRWCRLRDSAAFVVSNDSASPVEQLNVVNQIENESTVHGLSQVANERHKRFGLHAVSVIRVRLIRCVFPVVNAQFDTGVIRVFGCIGHGSSHRIEINVCDGTEYGFIIV